MTAPGRVRRAIVWLMALAFTSVVVVAALWINGRLLAVPRGEWSTQHFANPVELVAGESTIRATRFILNFERQLLTIERDELAFNDYGDATRTGGEPPLILPIHFSREHVNRFEIVLKNGFRQRFRLVVSPPPTNTHRLIVLGTTREWSRTPQRILELRGPEIVPDGLGDQPHSELFHFHSLTYDREMPSGKNGSGIHGIGVSGTLATGGNVNIDPNRYHFDPDGNIITTTLLAGPSYPVLFMPLGPDPGNMGRRAYELVLDTIKANEQTRLWGGKPPDISGRYVLVLGPTEWSEQRLVIRSEGKVQQVLRLRNRDIDNHVYMLRRLDEASEDEQRAYRELTQISGYQTIATVWKGHVTSISRLQGEKDKINPILARFPQLSQVHFMDGETRKLP